MMGAPSIIAHRLHLDPLVLLVRNPLARLDSFSNYRWQTTTRNKRDKLIRITIISLKMGNNIWTMTNNRMGIWDN